eukprot:gene4467-4714_t
MEPDTTSEQAGAPPPSEEVGSPVLRLVRAPCETDGPAPSQTAEAPALFGGTGRRQAALGQAPSLGHGAGCRADDRPSREGIGSNYEGQLQRSPQLLLCTLYRYAAAEPGIQRGIASWADFTPDKPWAPDAPVSTS